MSEYFPDAELRESNATLLGESVVSGMRIQMLLGAVFVVVGCFVSVMGFSNGEMAAKIFGIVFALVGLLVLIGAVVKFMASSTPDVIRGEFEFTIPEDAMHSFVAADNRIDWLLQVHTDVAGWPDYNSDVALQVAPRYVSIKGES